MPGSRSVPRKARTPGTPLLNVNAALAAKFSPLTSPKAALWWVAPMTLADYTVVKVLKVVEPEAPTPDKLKALSQRLASQVGGDLSTAYLGALKDRIKVEVKKGAGQRQSRQATPNGAGDQKFCMAASRGCRSS